MYKTVTTENDIAVEDYLKEYVNAEKFIKYCQKCPNYNNKYSCPPYDFDVYEYWRNFSELHIIGRQFFFDKEVRKKVYDKEESDKIIAQINLTELKRFNSELLIMEKEQPSSRALFAGSCIFCFEGCNKLSSKPCRHPDKIRYSIESLGGDVEKTAHKLLGIELKWACDGILPEYLTLVAGLLK